MWKFSKIIIKKIFLIKTLTSENLHSIILFDKSSTIPKCFKQTIVKIYKGGVFKLLKIEKYVIGKKFGEFVFTRKPNTFIKKKKKAANQIRR